MTKHADDKKKINQDKDGPNISVFNFSAESNPEISENSQGQWVDYGEENLYPQLIIQKYRKSAVHNSLVNGISQFVAGEDIQGLQDPERTNSVGDTFHDIFQKCAFDQKLHGYWGYQAIYSLDGSRIVDRIHVPAEKIRSGIADKFGVIHNYYIHPNWEDTRKIKPVKIAAFNPADGKKDGKQLVFVKIPSPGQFYYAAPDYIGAMNYISLDDSISEFHLDNIQTGFFPSALVQFFNGDTTEDQQRHIEKTFNNKFAGARGKKIAFVFNKNKNQSVQFDTFEPADLDERFKNLGPQVTEKIMIAHRVTSPMLFGVKTDAGLGNNADELKTGLLIFNKMVILPKQKNLLRGFQKSFINEDAGTVLEVVSLQPEEFLNPGNDGDVSSQVEPGQDPGIDPATDQDPKAVSGEPIGISTPVTPGSTEKQLEAQAGLRGSVGGVQGILQIQSAVAEGLTSFESAVSMLVEIYGFTEDVAIELLGSKTAENAKDAENEQPTVMNRESIPDLPKGSKLNHDKILKQMDKTGEKKSDLLKTHDLISVPDSVPDDQIEAWLKKIQKFAIESDPDERSSLDKGLFKVRYEYDGPQDQKNRTFCAQVLQKDLIYRKEDINKMSFTTSNPEFGTYSIFKYKGSYGCRHRWKRLIFFRKRSSSGAFLPNEGLENDVLLPGNQEAKVPEGATESAATSVNPKPSK